LCILVSANNVTAGCNRSKARISARLRALKIQEVRLEICKN
jgi:hypothetical protein